MNNIIPQLKFLDLQRVLKTPHLSLKVFMVIIILLTMFNNLEHSASVYLGISYNAAHADWYNKFQSYMVVIVFDLAVIAFIIKAKNTESVVFAIMLFVINCLFFNVFQSLYSIFYQASSIPSELLKQDQEAVKSLIGEIMPWWQRYCLLLCSVIASIALVIYGTIREKTKYYIRSRLRKNVLLSTFKLKIKEL